ncbi:hypothetical protein CYMTET_34031 [Cymbomonas tetramitiformis]|uniref:Uncharacterized protein n=1 Tax=Cymbomonas tetramitiformis TaxID=36881 RepID=A0AAE0FBZ1_9CHLO|nr:hypothetical protein CYMTET_34031 [Cymbomonas tetramitiformis]
MASGSVERPLGSLASHCLTPLPPAPCLVHPCFPGVQCENVPSEESLGSMGFRCLGCPSGYEGDGVACLDIDECAALLNGGCDNATACTNLPDGAGRTCSACPAGFTGSGETACVDDNEVLPPSDPSRFGSPGPSLADP